MAKKNRNIITGHNFCQYRRKYGKKFDRGKLEYFTLDNKNKLNSKKKYWEIRDGKKPGYFQIPKKKGLLIFFILFGAAALTTAIAVPTTLLTRKKGYEAKVDIEGDCSYEIEGGESLEGHNAGETIIIDFKVEWGVDFKVEVHGAESYEYDDATGKLTITFGEKDVQIVAQTTTAETITDPNAPGAIEVTYPNNEVKTFSINEFRQDIIDTTDSVTYETYRGCSAKLLKNINLDESVNFEPFADNYEESWYCGDFNGNYKSFKITETAGGFTGYDSGLFGSVYGPEEKPTAFYNLKLDLNIASGAKRQFVGGLIGYAIGSLDINNVEVDGIVKGSRVVGGLVGNISVNESDAAISHFNNCLVNADVQGFAFNSSDSWIKVGGIVGQNGLGHIGGEYEETAGLEINNCSFGGKLSDDYSVGPANHYSLMGYVTSSSSSEGDTEKTIINNFKVLEGATIVSNTTSTTHNYPFEGLNSSTGQPSYTGTPNYYKELVGGYFNTVIVDGEVNPTKQGVYFPHGGTY